MKNKRMDKLGLHTFLALLTMLLFFSNLAVAANSSTMQPVTKGAFIDVGQDDGYYPYVRFLADRNIVAGFKDSTFRSQGSLTRAQAAALLVKAFDLKSSTSGSKTPFKDLAVTYWAANAIKTAYEAGLIAGYPDGTFRPEKHLNRAEGVSMLLRLSDLRGSNPLGRYSDLPKNHWAAAAFEIAGETGMVDSPEQSVRAYPERDFIRGEVARALASLLTTDPSKFGTALTYTVESRASVKIRRAGESNDSELKGSTQFQPGDELTTGPNSEAEINFPDGSGLLLKGNTRLVLNEFQGRNYIKPDGTAGTAIEFLDVQLKYGKMFGNLASSHEEGDQAATNQKAVPESMVRALAVNRNRQISKKNDELPWWKATKTKKVKVKVDMPWGVAAIRGTFWETTVEANGRTTVSVLMGGASVTAGGETVDLSDYQRTEIGASGGLPQQPSGFTSDDQVEWTSVAQWVRVRAQAVQDNLGILNINIPGNINLIVTMNSALQKVQPLRKSGNGGSSNHSGSSVPVTGVFLNRDTINWPDLLESDNPVQLTATILPGDAADKTLIWTTSNPDVAVVVDGLVVPVGLSTNLSTAVITVKTRDGAYSDQCTVTIGGMNNV